MDYNSGYTKYSDKSIWGGKTNNGKMGKRNVVS